MRCVGVAEFRVGDNLDTGCTGIDKKKRFIVLVGQVCLEPHERRQIAACYVPFLTVQHVVIPVANRRCFEARHVRSRACFRDRVAVLFLTAHHRQDVRL